MQTIISPDLCSGCHACYRICPRGCISMKRDNDGFLYPVIDDMHCIDCGLCRTVCLKQGQQREKSGKKAYACISKNENIRINSSSGGVFSVLAEYVLSQNGVVFGAAFDAEFNVCHLAIESFKELEKIRGSKYVQSTIGDSFKLTKGYLENGRTVFFTGTPCQISGLKAYLGKEYENLYLQDIICHGVPSPKAWGKYLFEKKKKTQLSEIKKVNFRDKKNGWLGYVLSISDGFQSYDGKKTEDAYMRAFLEGIVLRKSCYKCRFKGSRRDSDITLADFWGINKISADMFDNKGTSLVIINSPKGQKLFNEISSKLKIKEVRFDDAVNYNRSYYKSGKMPFKERKKFFRMIDDTDFDIALERCARKRIIRKMFHSIKRKLKGMLKNVQR